MIPWLLRLPIAASTLLLSLSVAAVGNNLNANHPCTQLIMERHTEKILGQLGVVGQNTINRIKTPDIEEQPVQQPVDDQFSPRQAGGTAWECVASTVQGVPSTVKYVAGSVAGSVVGSFNQGEPQRALRDILSTGQGVAHNGFSALNNLLPGLQQRQ